MAEIPATGDLPDELFEQYGHEVLGLIREFFATIDDRPVLATIAPEELRALLAEELPAAPIPFEETLRATREKIIPHLTHWNHPGFHAYFANSAAYPGILAETLAAALNVNAMLWRTAPAASALEEVVLGWLAELVGYPADSDGVFVNGASLATFYALAAARDSVGPWDVRREGLSGRDLPRLRMYCSDQTHNSIDKAAIALGIGLNNLVKISTDDRFAMRPDSLRTAIQADRDAGFVPFAAVSNLGSTSTAGFDPLAEIDGICREYGMWHHIDAAYGGLWRIVPEVRELTGDVGLGDSLVINPHKTLYTPMEATVLYCKRRGLLRETFSVAAEYLATSEQDVPNYMDFSLQLGRSFRSLKVWMIMRTFGVDGLRGRMQEHLRLARDLARQIAGHPDFELLAESPFGLVSFRARPRGMRPGPGLDELNQRLMAQVNASGHSYISHTALPAGYALRVSIGNIRTAERHVAQLWNALVAGLDALNAS
ncbi:MAG TPA: pyridoxal-dependent decarboxylase [Herpetosiphonaceae bacterium]